MALKLHLISGALCFVVGFWVALNLQQYSIRAALPARNPIADSVPPGIELHASSIAPKAVASGPIASSPLASATPSPSPPQESRSEAHQPPTHHIVITSCDEHYRWMIYSMFFSAKRVGQTGPITWLRTDCGKTCPGSPHPGGLCVETPPSQEEMRAIYPEVTVWDIDLDLKMKDGSSFRFAMLPQGMQKFMSAHPEMSNETIVCLLDADLIFLSPLKLDAHSLVSKGLAMQGRALWTVAQNGNMSKLDLAGKGWNTLAQDHAPVVSGPQHHYTLPPDTRLVGGMLGLSQTWDCCEGTGPPRMASAGAWRVLAKEWQDVLVKIYVGGNQDEQIAFGTAYRNLGMEFNIFDHLAIDSPEGAGNAWPVVEEKLASLSSDPCATPDFDTDGAVFFHMAQVWRMDPNNETSWRFNKYLIPPGWQRPTRSEGILGCDMPMFAHPPADLFQTATTARDKRCAWGVCTAVHSLNRMLQFLKERRCNGQFNQRKVLRMGENWVNLILPSSDSPPSQREVDATMNCGASLVC